MRLKYIKSLFLTALISITCSFSVLADEIPCNSHIKETTVSPDIDYGFIKPGEGYDHKKLEHIVVMIDDLYRNEENINIRKAACELAVISTFGQEKAYENNFYTSSTYLNENEFLRIAATFIVENHATFFGDGNDGIFLYIGKDESYYDKLVTFYEDAKSLKSRVMHLPERARAEKIHDYICDRVEYDMTLTKRPMINSYIEGKALCEDYAGLFYVLGTYCGLDVRTVYGPTTSTFHAWNEVSIDGEWSYMDVTWDDCGKNKKYLSFKDDKDHLPILHEDFLTLRKSYWDSTGMNIEQYNNAQKQKAQAANAGN